MKPKHLFKSGLLLLLAVLLLMPPRVSGQDKADRVLVDKSEYRMWLFKNDQVIAEYPVRFGGNPQGHKQQQGDQRTPEGHYVLDYRNPNSRYHRSIHISYPDRQDRTAASRRGVSPGGDIFIHGQPNGWGFAGLVLQQFNWTDGCIAVTNDAMDEIWNTVPNGTPIEIRP